MSIDLISLGSNTVVLLSQGQSLPLEAQTIQLIQTDLSPAMPSIETRMHKEGLWSSFIRGNEFQHVGPYLSGHTINVEFAERQYTR